MAEITGVTFKEGGKVYYFAPQEGARYETGKGVVVETARGVEYATVVIPYAEVEDEKIVSPLKPIIRAATPRDEEMHRKNTERKEGAMQTVRERIRKFNLEMKLIDCEFAFDGSKAVFYYSAPQRVDFRELVKDLSSVFRMRIELRQVGIRDEIKMFGGLAPCGRECCCASCMPDLKKVSIKMAKNQGLSLNPGKISGLCGRLMCCLAYENDYYAEACKKMPKIGSEINTPDGPGMVVNVNMLKMEVRVKIEDKGKDIFTYKDYPIDGLKCRACPHAEGEEREDAVAAERTEEPAAGEKQEKRRNEKPRSDRKPTEAPRSEKKRAGAAERGGARPEKQNAAKVSSSDGRPAAQNGDKKPDAARQKGRNDKRRRQRSHAGNGKKDNREEIHE